ncbi:MULTISPECIES: type IV pilin protein [unclassified Pseudomonas]|uniref:type IV pilin protein n=1 Tax=unclassified Pseudomonas TaxID=196821 RepID=UPI0009DA556A|nr:MULTISPECIES: type IV pilin protein [unclassified Pseudomonas]MBD9517649.1 prepilin-type N-terminal cleavage/methylation domain-containing protein [Pseudomonas sp. PDM22]MBD9631987.1 prepilin-type N-terminal cleavage/methylation domain-containing protein [Pseudomonas sp. PDM19]OQR34471.1 hypothetical protein BWR15_10800 [Pseudomonas sp. T]
MKRQTGFTLLELMMAVIVVGILTAIALPSYQGYVRRAACENAKSVLVGAGNVMERFRAQNNTYSGANLGGYASSPVDGSAKDATIAVTASDATSYTLTATPTTGGRLRSKGTLTLSSTGARGGTGELATKWGSCNGI